MSKRFERLKKQIAMRIAELIPAEIRDPRVHRADTVTVTAVKVAPDLRFARVLVSIKSEDEAIRAGAMSAIEQSRGFVRRSLGERMRLRHVPELAFVLDETADSAARIEQILRDLAHERGDAGQDD